MFSEKVSEKLATQEINKWLDFKKVSVKKREGNSQVIEQLIEAVQYGFLSVNEDCSLTQTLKFPLKDDEDNEQLSALTYKPRLDVDSLNSRMATLKNVQDINSRLKMYVAALTDVNSGLIGKIDSEDNSVSQAIVVFFL